MYPFKGMEFLFIGFAAGFAHVISGADHLAALAPFAARREQHAAWRLGLHWGLGHACGVALIGLLVWLLKGTAAAEWLSTGAEQLVGVLLISIGALGIRSLLRHRIHTNEHDHFGIQGRPNRLKKWTFQGLDFSIGSFHQPNFFEGAIII